MDLNKTRLSLGLLIIILIICSFTAAAKTTAAVTIVPQLEMVKAVAGDKLQVTEMIPKGFSPSNYAPSPAEMRAFNDANIYFSIGVPADMQNILPRAEDEKNLRVVKLFERIESEYPHHYFGEDPKADADQTEKDSHGHSHSSGRDPHIWLSPARASYMVEIIRDELIKILPEYKAEFKKNAEEYLEKLREVDQNNQEILAPYKGENILVYHPSFGYFLEHYGLGMMAIEAAGKEPGPRHLQEIIETAKKQGIKNVFYQAEIDSAKTRAVAEELDGEIVQLKPLAENYIENLEVMAAKMAAELEERDDH